MSQCSFVAEATLVSEGATGRLYLVSSEFFAEKDYLEKNDGDAAVDVIDLRTNRRCVVKRSELVGHSIPDAGVGRALCEHAVQGIKTPYRRAPIVNNPKDIPLEGNVLNPKWAHIILGGACNSRCVFCYTEWLRQYPNFTRHQVISIIDRLARIGTVELVVFSGGEATINPDLAFFFSYAQSIGFSKIGLQTNGRELRTCESVSRLTKFGLTCVLLSMHGPTESVHDKITGVPGSFAEASACLNVLRETNVTITVNFVICQENQPYMLDMVRFMADTLGDKGTLRFSYPIVEGAAFDNRQKILVPFSVIKRSMSDAIDLAQTVGLGLEAANMPLCIPDERYGKTTYDMDVLSTFVQASPFYQYNVARGERALKLSTCAVCRHANLCRGIQFEYLRAFPDSAGEFTPACVAQPDTKQL